MAEKPGLLITQTRKNGSSNALTIKEAVKGADVICTCFDNSKDFERFIFGDDGVTSHAKRGATIIDFSKIGTNEITVQKLKYHNLTFMNAGLFTIWVNSFTNYDRFSVLC